MIRPTGRTQRLADSESRLIYMAEKAQNDPQVGE